MTNTSHSKNTLKLRRKVQSKIFFCEIEILFTFNFFYKKKITFTCKTCLSVTIKQGVQQKQAGQRRRVGVRRPARPVQVAAGEENRPEPPRQRGSGALPDLVGRQRGEVHRGLFQARTVAGIYSDEYLYSIIVHSYVFILMYIVYI